jgi:hypothetical protein
VDADETPAKINKSMGLRGRKKNQIRVGNSLPYCTSPPTLFPFFPFIPGLLLAFYHQITFVEIMDIESNPTFKFHLCGLKKFQWCSSCIPKTKENQEMALLEYIIYSENKGF